MRPTVLGLLTWLHYALLPFRSEPSPPTEFIAPDFTCVTLIYNASLPESPDEGRELVDSVIKQYIQLGFGKPGINDLAYLRTYEEHLLRMLRKPFDFQRFNGQNLV